MRKASSLLVSVAISQFGCAGSNNDAIVSSRMQSVGLWAGDNSLGLGFTSKESHFIPVRTASENISFLANLGSNNAQRLVAVGQAANAAAEMLAQQSSGSAGGSRYSVFRLESDNYILDHFTGTVYLVGGDQKRGLDLSKEIGKIGRKPSP